MKYEEIISKVSRDLNLPEELVKKTNDAYWGFIRSSLDSLPLKEDLTQEEFSKLHTNINIPSLGKLNCTYERYIGMKNRFSVIKKLRNKT